MHLILFDILFVVVVVPVQRRRRRKKAGEEGGLREAVLCFSCSMPPGTFLQCELCLQAGLAWRLSTFQPTKTMPASGLGEGRLFIPDKKTHCVCIWHCFNSYIFLFHFWFWEKGEGCTAHHLQEKHFLFQCGWDFLCVRLFAHLFLMLLREARGGRGGMPSCHPKALMPVHFQCHLALRTKQ